MTEFQRLQDGLLHDFTNSREMDEEKANAQRLLSQFNDPNTSFERRVAIQKELIGEVEGMCLIIPPFRCEYGKFIHIGNGSFLNYDCLILDGCKISIGCHVYIGPRTIITTASHPIYAPVRVEHYGIHKPVVIEDNVWIGAGSIILPGAFIGRNSVIGAGSVVTAKGRIPQDCIAFGNPCQVHRMISEEDKAYWEGLKSEYLKEMKCSR